MIKHGMYGTPEHNSWCAMVQRCTNPKAANYRHYGGRGIAIDPSMRTFEGFFTVLGPKPGPGYMVDRIDNDGPYAPGNVRWADQMTSVYNRRPHPGRPDSRPGFIGVTKDGKKWVARVCVRGKQHSLGNFDTPELARDARERFLKEQAIGLQSKPTKDPTRNHRGPRPRGTGYVD